MLRENFTDLLRIIGKRPGLHLAPDKDGYCDSIRELYSFILGFEMAQVVDDDTSVLNAFTFWVCHHYGVPDGSRNWHGHILERAGGDDAAAFRLFFELFEEYLKDREAVGPEAIQARFIAMLEELNRKRKDWPLRLAREDDVPAIDALIPISVRALQAPYYSPAQMEAALGPVFAVDRQLIRDGTYFVAEHEGQIVGCGGWSRRQSLYGGDAGRSEPNPELDPARDAARVRAFFVHPSWARRGIGRSIMNACEEAIHEAGFRRVDIVATLAGEPLYAAFGYEVVERYDIVISDSVRLPAVRMTKSF